MCEKFKLLFGIRGNFMIFRRIFEDVFENFRETMRVIG